jgi:hypothetical protein
MSIFETGQIIERREVLKDEIWMTSPVTVVHDDGDTLAVRLDPGSSFTFPSHPFGVHPWSQHTEWGGSIVLQVHRRGDLYSAWKFFTPDGVFLHWYINFEAPLKRGPRHIDTDDYGLDLIVDADGRRTWKDVVDLHHQRTEGRISSQTVLDVLAEAAHVEAALDRDERWWSSWDDWSPTTSGDTAPGDAAGRGARVGGFRDGRCATSSTSDRTAGRGRRPGRGVSRRSLRDLLNQRPDRRSGSPGRAVSRRSLRDVLNQRPDRRSRKAPGSGGFVTVAARPPQPAVLPAGRGRTKSCHETWPGLGGFVTVAARPPQPAT